MPSYLQVEKLTKSIGDRVLFSDITFGVNEGDKIGLIAKNGTGKTTLLRCLAGEISPDSGEIIYRNGIKTAYLDQTPFFDSDMTVLEAAFATETPATIAIAKYETALASGDNDKIAKAVEIMDRENAWDYEDLMKQMLFQLHLTDLSQKVGTLSGGQQKRLALARILLDHPDFVLLDEPTNHLDIETVEWLENYLSRAKMTILMVTHDRYFLDRICSKIIELDRTQAFSYDGNYDYYIRRRSERIEAMTAELARVKNTLRKEQDWMNRQPQARAGKAKYRIDAFYDLKDRAAVSLKEKNVALDVKSSYIGSKIFEAEHISKSFGSKVILDDFNYIFSRYEKLGIIGVNGVGKTTFIKMLQGLVQPDKGTWNVGETVRFGYYSQHGIEFDENKQVIDAITEKTEDIVFDGGERISPMNFLQKFLFSPADQQKYIHTLSGGERARLHLASVLMTSPNFLILDEPTNDLDIITLGLLEEYLASFSGCVIVISHDRFFLDSIVDHLFVFEGNGVIRDFSGNYTEYREYIARQRAREAEETSKQTDSTPSPKKQKTETRRLSFKEKKELEQLTLELEKLNEEKSALEQIFNSGEQLDRITENSARFEEIKSLIDEKEMRWLELSEIEG
ncbi:MAG: ABC-F family ATP-binding cassette domain-containing protein [Muribaculaceae bacterium]|nr:ABC-F family ATP-binding cassette domain-containing protein [Muribaculaceae bacterium]MDE5858363.1 ABC-F family ATP-binding cassette domain-containing protein [Muribaculaceae bacterium]